MFDTHHNHISHVTRNSKVDVTERRAPTDESVRLLREMENAAKQEVIESIRCENNLVKAVLHSTIDHMSDLYRYRIIMDINGKRFVDDFHLDFDMKKKPLEFYEEVYKKMSEILARSMISELTKNHTGW